MEGLKISPAGASDKLAQIDRRGAQPECRPRHPRHAGLPAARNSVSPSPVAPLWSGYAIIALNVLVQEASVTRSWFHTLQDLRAEIKRLRQRHPAASSAPPLQRQRASDPSLLRRLEAATTRIRHMETDKHRLRDALAHALGERRAAGVVGQADRDTPKRNSPELIRPC